jgi:hypothetical protein
MTTPKGVKLGVGVDCTELIELADMGNIRIIIDDVKAINENLRRIGLILLFTTCLDH